MKPFFSFRKPTHLLRQGYKLFQQRKESLSEEKKSLFYELLKNTQEAIDLQDQERAKKASKALEKAIPLFFPKTSFEKGKNLLFAIAFALCVTILIRQIWFELYQIPTGSMRPTLKEQDRLTVSKTAFGLNIPLSVNHLYFSPELVKRNGIVVFTGENMDLKDVDTLYFYLFPGKKQYIKRLIGKPGDILYFYGGLIYGIDKEGHDISQELQLARLSLIDHIPFLQFDGKASTPDTPIRGVYTPVLLRQMNQPIAQLSLSPFNKLEGVMLPPYKETNLSYSQLWGMENFAMSQIVNKEEALRRSPVPLPEAPLYLEIRHHPDLHNLKVGQDTRGRIRPLFDLSSSFLPLDEAHIRTLFQNLYTVRFVVEKEKAYQYGLPKEYLSSPFLPTLPGIPDGTYEFYYGKAYKILFQGISIELRKDHPIYECTPERVQLLYNLGMVFDTRFSPSSRYPSFLPPRYSYFRNGAFYAMGAELFSQGDQTLRSFIEQEQTRGQNSSYVPFLDKGPPLKEDGTIDSLFIQTHGIVVPEKMYLVLGDNHAVSADSREFGFLPQENIRGAPDFVFWPIGSSFGHPNQPPYPLFTIPRFIVWITALFILGGAGLWQKRKNTVPKL